MSEHQPAPRNPAGPASLAPRLAAALFGAASVAWTATPLLHRGLATFALVLAIISVLGGALRLAFADLPQPENPYWQPGYLRAWSTLLTVTRTVPWEEAAVLATLWLEVQHTIRPWHTAALGAALAAYLLTTHIAESGAAPGPLLRRQARLLIAGAALLAVGAGFAEIPAMAPGAGSAVLRVLAAVAVIAATVLVLPAG